MLIPAKLRIHSAMPRSILPYIHGALRNRQDDQATNMSTIDVGFKN
jgi:hypothetical protein